MFLSKDETIPAKLIIKAEVDLPTGPSLENDFQDRIFQVWLRLDNIDNQF